MIFWQVRRKKGTLLTIQIITFYNMHIMSILGSIFLMTLITMQLSHLLGSLNNMDYMKMSLVCYLFAYSTFMFKILLYSFSRSTIE